MAISFPNRSRSYDATRQAVRFWGYDRSMESSFFVTVDALERPSVNLGALAREVLATRADAIIQADSQGIIQFWNPGAERIFGFSGAEAVGQSLDIIIPERLRKRHWDGWK